MCSAEGQLPDYLTVFGCTGNWQIRLRRHRVSQPLLSDSHTLERGGLAVLVLVDTDAEVYFFTAGVLAKCGRQTKNGIGRSSLDGF